MKEAISSGIDRFNGLCAAIPGSLVALLARLAVFFVFWRSVQNKIDGLEILGQKFAFWNVTDNTVFLFKFEYGLPGLPPALVAHLATWGEFFLSLGLLLGFATRLSALGLLIMTAVIQLLVYPSSWPVHILWAAALLYLLKAGGGSLSVDYLLRRR